ncbi:MAG: hypothetical protein H6538_07500 [Bacteroidales bacterium]|nr:hypothetical protein [Bacteroidales bacterium]
MKDLFLRILKGSKSSPPESIKIDFKTRFPEAVSVEWHKEGNHYESIFVYQGKEIICRYDHNLKWADTRTNLLPEEINQKVKDKMYEFGELMSSILIENSEGKIYEFVVRDKDMNRKIYFTDISGKIIDKQGFNSVYDLF